MRTIRAASGWAVQLFLLCAMPMAPAAAQDLSERTAGGFHTGLAGATTLCRDSAATGLLGNPALLPFARRSVSVGVALATAARAVHRESPVVNRPFAEDRDASGVSLAPTIAIAVPLVGERWVVAAGFSIPVARHVQYPAVLATDGTRTDAARYLGSELALHQYTLAVGTATRPWSRLALGAGIELSQQVLDYRTTLFAGTAADRVELLDPTRPARHDLAARFSGKSDFFPLARIGLWFAPTSSTEVAATLRVPLAQGAIAGELTLDPVSSPPTGYTTIASQGGHATVGSMLPLEVRGGIAQRIAWARLIAELSWTGWSQLAPIGIQSPAARLLLTTGGQVTERPVADIPVVTQLRDRYVIHAAAELAPIQRLTVRLGYAYHVGATTADAPAAPLIDLDHHEIAVGISVRPHQRFALHFAVAHALANELSVATSSTAVTNPVAPAETVKIGAGIYRGGRTDVDLGLSVDY